MCLNDEGNGNDAVVQNGARPEKELRTVPLPTLRAL
jgi:hypothetical protein